MDDLGAFGWLRDVQDRTIMLENPPLGRQHHGEGLFVAAVGRVRSVERMHSRCERPT
jgi:hypothetical protein